ncbi:hypothetical protein BRAS3843_3310006 [Bradyrhizobium sp. STM 3843]|nr:hypothetical protein BRAS3843_3310006 [Bradyrhizobium sp. STM 3843]
MENHRALLPIDLQAFRVTLSAAYWEQLKLLAASIGPDV